MVEQPNNDERVVLTLSLHKAGIWLSCALLALGFFHLLTWYLHFHTPLELYTLFRIFDFDGEANIPTLFNTFLLAVSAFLMLLIGRQRRTGELPYARHWQLLGLLFLFLTVDEFTSIHETMVKPFREMLDIEGGIFYPAWVIPALILLIPLAIVLFRFILDLPRPVRIIFLISAVVYLSGSIGMEMINGVITTSFQGMYDLRRLAMMLEESLERAGLILFIRGLLVYAIDQALSLEVEVGP